MTYPTHLRADQFNRIAPALPGYIGSVGRPVQDNRRFSEDIVWMGRSGDRWPSLPDVYGK